MKTSSFFNFSSSLLVSFFSGALTGSGKGFLLVFDAYQCGIYLLGKRHRLVGKCIAIAVTALYGNNKLLCFSGLLSGVKNGMLISGFHTVFQVAGMLCKGKVCHGKRIKQHQIVFHFVLY